MKFELCYPQWKDRAVTFSYDDGQIFDRRLVDIFNKYNLKATFHLNSGTLDTEGFIKTQELKSLYQGHEIACHGVAHEYPTHLSQERLVQEFYQDRCSLERETGRIIRGCSYAFGEYDERVINTLKNLGFAYSRTVESTGNFRIPEDFMRWTPSCHHNDAFRGIAEKFLHTPDYQKLPLLYVWGHSFEFDREQTWEQMESFCREISGHENVWYTTNMDYVNYMNAARNLIFNAECTHAENLSKIKIYCKINGECQIL